MSVAGVLASISIYPIKGTRAIELTRSEVEPRGLKNDRRHVIVDEEGLFFSQRNKPELATIQAIPMPSGLRLQDAAGQSVDIDGRTNERRFVQIWQDFVDAVDMGDEAAAWLSERLDTKCRLVRMDDSSHRATHPDFSEPGDQVSFADGFPLLLTNQASLDDLNAQLQTPVQMNRFRPNVVVEGFEPWDESKWSRVRIGECQFKVVKPCARCLVTTTDQTTGERRGPEPLKTLATYRQIDGKAIFGQNLIPTKLGAIHVRHEIEVLS